VEYNLEFKKNKISLDFCFFSAMEKKREQHFNYDDTKWSKHFNKNKKKLIYYKKISRRSYLHAGEMTSRFVNVLACHSEMSLFSD
jgi:hypothetical protein